MSTLLKNKILKELNAVNWSRYNDENSDKAFEAIINGIYNYINTEYVFNGVFIGIQATVPVPTAVTGTSTHTLHIINTSFLDTFKTTVRNGVDMGGIERMFLGIQTMLLGMIQADITTLTSVPPGMVVLPPLGTPLVPVIFPSVSLFGTPCALEVMGFKPNNKEDFWGIFSKYVQQGLNLNVVPPIPTSGAIAFPVTGLTTGILVFN